MFRRLTGTLLAGLLIGAVVAVPAPAADSGSGPADRADDRSAAADAAPPQDGPRAAVVRRLGETADAVGLAGPAAEPRVTVNRQQKAWAFGTAVLATEPGSEEMPQGWLFLAREVGGVWQVALEGDPAFARWSRQAPVLEADETRAFSATATKPSTLANGDFRTGMGLPFATGQTWSMPGGPHGWSGTAAPWSSLDLAGGDQVVRAARAGTAYTLCKGWVRVVHDRGYATDYYHLWDNVAVDGAAVGAGAYLGYTGTDVTCGGSAHGRHVHFALRQNNAYVGIADHNVGKWVPRNGNSAYSGSALHGSRQVAAGGSVYNYGPLGFQQGVVDTNGGTTLNKRTGPGTSYPAAGTVTDGATVTVSCSANGSSHTGRWGTTSLWNRLSDGTWVSDAFLWTGSAGTVSGWC
jgi:LasA protease